MSRWTFDSDEAHLCVTCQGPTVTVGASISAEIDLLAVVGDPSDQYIGFSLPPDKAREMAEWLVLYAKEAESY